MASTNGLVPISRAGAFLSSYYNKYPLLPEEDIELAGVHRKSKDKFEVALELVESFQSKNSNNVFNTVMSCMPQDSRGTLVRQKRERSKTNKQAEIDADRYALLWNQQMERRRQLFQLGSATGVYKTLVKYLVGVPQVLLDFITQINGDHGPMEEQRADKLLSRFS